MSQAHQSPSVPAPIREETVEISVSDGTRMRGYWAAPQNRRQAPGLLLFQEAFGVNEHIKDVARRLAGQGYSVVAPELFHRSAEAGAQFAYADFKTALPHVQALSDEGLEADIRAGHEWLAAPSRAGAQAIGAVGFCMGGRTAFLAASTVPLKAAVSYYGGGIAPMERLKNPGLLDRVPALKAPVLFYWGGLDRNIPASERRLAEEALEKAGKPYAWVVFADADHGFFCDARASYQAAAAAQSWSLTLEFLKTFLR